MPELKSTNITELLSKSKLIVDVGDKNKKNKLIKRALLFIAGSTLLTYLFLPHEDKKIQPTINNIEISSQNIINPQKISNIIQKNDKITINSATAVVDDDIQNILDSRKAIEKLDLKLSDNRDSIVEKSLNNNENFMAFAVRLEDIKTTVYYDPGGANIGAGFCITKQLTLHSREEVIQMLEDAKIDHNTAVSLTNPKMTDLKHPIRKLSKGLNISPESALILTKSLQRNYESTLISAFNTIGSSVSPNKGDQQGVKLFNKLSPNEKAAYTWLNYNADISRFKRLIKSIYILHGEDSTNKQKAIAKNMIMKNLAPMYRENGALVKNVRAEAYLVSGMYDEAALSFALRNPAQIESRQGDVQNLSKYLKNIKNKDIAIQSLEQKGISSKETIINKIKNKNEQNIIKHKNNLKL